MNEIQTRESQLMKPIDNEFLLSVETVLDIGIVDWEREWERTSCWLWSFHTCPVINNILAHLIMRPTLLISRLVFLNVCLFLRDY